MRSGEMRHTLAIALLLFTASSALAQESRFGAELRQERMKIGEDCAELSRFFSCATTLATDQPIHVAFGSIAPQNGLGFGVAVVGHETPNEDWRLTWSGDVVGALSGAWRGGVYAQFIRTAVQAPGVIAGGSGSQPGATAQRVYPIIKLYAQTISLPRVSFYGLGSQSARDSQTFFGLRETIVGGSGILPWAKAGRLNLSFLGEMNGRFVTVKQALGEDSPSIEQLFSDATAPGLVTQPSFLQLGEGIRIRPVVLDGHVRLNYTAQLQQFFAPSDSTYAFRRWNIDLNHEFPVYRDSVAASPRDGNGPNECAVDPGNRANRACSATTRNRTGTVSFRVLASRSSASDESIVPFYFQQTLGGSDINGDRSLPSYDDYRFRGTRLFLLQESFEHSLFDWPVGIWFGADQGQVSTAGQDGDFLHSFGIGLTLRAGGFPAVALTWATGGSEGHHTSFTISTSLLGGSARPSLY